MDVRLHFSERGTGDPLILLHGNGEDGSYFSGQVECFASAYRVIALDTRGHGASPRGTAPFTLAQFAQDLADFMDEQGVKSANLLGFSDGANIALLFALAHPERVRALVLNGANLFFEGLTAQTRREIERDYDAALAAGDDERLAFLRLMIDEPRIDPSDLGRLAMPVLVVAGTDDMIDDAHTRLIARSIPAAQLALIEGTHFIAAENPSEFNRVVEAFLNQAVGR